MTFYKTCYHVYMEQIKKSLKKAINSTESVLYYVGRDGGPLCVVSDLDQAIASRYVAQALLYGARTIITEKKNAEAVSGICEGLVPGVSYLFVRSLEAALVRREATPAIIA